MRVAGRLFAFALGVAWCIAGLQPGTRAQTRVSPTPAAVRPLLDKVAAYLKSYEQRMSAVVADESARYNLGIQRNINVPTMALAYLTNANQARSVFTEAGQATDAGVSVVVLGFRETASPTLIRDNGIDVPASGQVWIDAASGAVRRTQLQWSVAFGTAFSGTVLVHHGAVPGVAFLMPTSMDETYRKAGGEVDSGHATYADVRAFEVDVRTIGRGGGGVPRAR